jgi:hypothetical protein
MKSFKEYLQEKLLGKFDIPELTTLWDNDDWETQELDYKDVQVFINPTRLEMTKALSASKKTQSYNLGHHMIRGFINEKGDFIVYRGDVFHYKMAATLTHNGIFKKNGFTENPVDPDDSSLYFNELGKFYRNYVTVVIDRRMNLTLGDYDDNIKGWDDTIQKVADKYGIEVFPFNRV